MGSFERSETVTQLGGPLSRGLQRIRVVSDMLLGAANYKFCKDGIVFSEVPGADASK
jgi:hypothetical protein